MDRDVIICGSYCTVVFAVLPLRVVSLWYIFAIVASSFLEFEALFRACLRLDVHTHSTVATVRRWTLEWVCSTDLYWVKVRRLAEQSPLRHEERT